jgi:hypothetical protein
MIEDNIDFWGCGIVVFIVLFVVFFIGFVVILVSETVK